ncbi:MAG: hypothetical protein SFX73_10560 [Kofleriaceae bacterium]|nr:hypothetical protein [Kofleriaceae bacterium]
MASKKSEESRKVEMPSGEEARPRGIRGGPRPKGAKAADAGVYVRVERDRRALYVEAAAALGTTLNDVARVAWEELVKLAAERAEKERAAKVEAKKSTHRQRRIGSDIRMERKRASSGRG